MWFNNTFSSDFSKVYFIDESSFNLHLKRSYARSKSGSRANVISTTARGRSITLIASIGIDRIGHCKTITNSTVNANIFAEYLQEMCAHLKNNLNVENACLILDNAKVHKKADIERITSEFNFSYHFLAPYSYMLNPIENAFSKIKNGVRARLRLGQNMTLSEMIILEVNNVSANDCAGFFRYILKNITNCAAEIPYEHK